MRALVVYESMYGNTKEIAAAVADGLSTRMPVQLTEVGAAPTLLADDIGLLVVGGPTHAHGMSKAESANPPPSASLPRSLRSSPAASACETGLRASKPGQARRTSPPRSSTRGSRARG